MGLFGGGGGGGFGGFTSAISSGGIPGLSDVFAGGGGGAGGVLGGDFMSSLGDVFTGNSKDAGILGVGQYQAAPVGIDPNAYAASANQTSYRDQLAAQNNVAQGRQAPTADAAKMNFAQAKGVDDMTRARLGNAATMKAAQIDSARKANAAKVGPMATSNAAKVGPMASTDAARIEQAKQAQFRNQQQTLASQLADQAAGKGPSLAQSQLKQATGRNIAQAMALGASQRGATAGQGLRQIAQQTTAANQQAAQQSADLRMQEQLQARGQLGQVLDTGRGADIGLATSQAGLQQQAGLANQDAANQGRLAQSQLSQQTALANQDAANQGRLAQSQLSQQAELANQDAINSFRSQQAQLNQQAGLSNQDALNAFKTQRANMQQQANMANYGAANQRDLANAQLRQDAFGNNAQFQQQAALANQGAAMQQQGFNDAQSRYFNDAIVGMNEADRQALMAQQQLAVNQGLGIAGVNAGAYANTSKSRGDLLGKLGEGAAAMAGGMAYGGMVQPAQYSQQFGDVDVQRYLEQARREQDKSMVTEEKKGLSPATLKSLGSLGAGMAGGGLVPGKAPVPFDSAANDVVLTPLSPGEIVVPRTVAQDPNKTVAFVDAIRNQNPKAQTDNVQKRIDDLESQLAGVLSRRVQRSA